MGTLARRCAFATTTPAVPPMPPTPIHRRNAPARARAAALLLGLCLSWPVQAMGSAGGSTAVAWWVWPLALFVACFLIGIVAVPAGIGGGTLFVPLIGGFFPFHLDFVRGAGLLVALASALAAAPVLL
ncbi:MAG: hypothetical protein ACRC4O_12710, partial [Giesbergeria sp.]